MLPVITPEKKYHTLNEIQARKEQLAAELQHDNEQFSTLWNQLFVPRKDSTKGEWVSSLITNSVTAVDTFLLVRKLFKNYGHLFRKKNR